MRAPLLPLLPAKFRRPLKLALFAAALVLVGFVGRPVVFLASVWWHDPSAPLPPPAPGHGDFGRLSSAIPAEVIPVDADPAKAELQLAALVQRAGREGRHIAISGATHSMGGHTLLPDALELDMLPFNRLTLDAGHRLLTVGAGARWSQIIPFLDEQGLAVAVMQSNNDFSVGGSLSVDCHGWQNDAPPIASTVESFRLVTADGTIVRCSRTENAELFSLALGGYGLFGIILDARLRVVSNEFYRAESHRVAPAGYAAEYHRLTHQPAKDIGLAYGRISIAPDSFFNEAIIVLLKRQPAGAAGLSHTLTHEAPGMLKRVVFRGSVGSDYGKNLRWSLEKLVGETGGRLLSRNEIMNEPSDWYANRDPAATEILHEYFIPAARLGEFLERARPVFLRHHPDLLNVTLRNVEPDNDTLLRYAREEVFGLVMLFHQGTDAAAETAMQAFARDLIDTALACGGTYYLPYRPDATSRQFNAAYPMAADFFARKRRLDPAGVFQNEFYRNYGTPLAAATP